MTIRRLTSLLAATAAIAIVLLAAASPASSHPLGNFTVNRFARIEVSAGVVRVYYVLDEAEIPAFQERDAVAADRDGFLARRVQELARGLDLTVDGERLALSPVDRSLDQPPGQGGLRTLRVAAVFAAPLPERRTDQPHELRFEDGNEPDRLGWREIVAVARGDAEITSSSVPSDDISDELRDYPENLLQAPLDLRRAELAFSPGSETVEALPVPSSTAGVTRGGGAFASLITRQDLTPVVVLGLLGSGLALGAGHALLPGHGKTVMAAYLVGTRGRPFDAVALGAIVSIMHTASVLALGVVLFQVNRTARIDRYYPALTAVSGALAVGLGLWLFVTRARRARARRQHEHAHAHGHHHHHHDHHHGPGGHTHDLPEDVAPLSRRGLVLLATSGGIVPSPSAVVVVVSAFSLGRAALGLSLIAAFSVGLAATLTIVGLALVFGRDLAERRMPDRALRLLPLAGAVALMGFGGVLLVRGLSGWTT